MRVENVTTGEERKNSTCLGFHQLNKTIHKTNNDWDVSQNPGQESESTHKWNPFAGLDDLMYSTNSTPKDHHLGIHLPLWTFYQIWAKPQTHPHTAEPQIICWTASVVKLNTGMVCVSYRMLLLHRGIMGFELEFIWTAVLLHPE